MIRLKPDVSTRCYCNNSWLNLHTCRCARHCSSSFHARHQFWRLAACRMRWLMPGAAQMRRKTSFLRSVFDNLALWCWVDNVHWLVCTSTWLRLFTRHGKLPHTGTKGSVSATFFMPQSCVHLLLVFFKKKHACMQHHNNVQPSSTLLLVNRGMRASEHGQVRLRKEPSTL